MVKKKMVTYSTGKCTGCRLCMLACSWVSSGTYSSAASIIRIDVDEKCFTRAMTLDEENCSGCLSCVSACPDGALEAEDIGDKEAV